MSRGELGTYVASAFLADMVRDLRERGLLEGAVRDSVISSLENFVQRRTGDPREQWHVDLLELYEELTGRLPEAP